MVPNTNSGPVLGFLHPDQMEQGGLLGSGDGFDGRIIGMRYLPWDYNGKSDKWGWTLAVEVTYEVDEESETKTAVDYQTAGDLRHWLPSKDGRNPVSIPDDLDSLAGDADAINDLSGPFCIKVGKQKAMSNNTKLAEWIGHAIRAGFKIPMDTASLDVFVGIEGHFNRVPQKARNIKDDDAAADTAGKGPKDILVLTEYRGMAKSSSVAGGKAAAPAAASASASASPVAATAANGGAGTGTGTDNSAIEDAILEFLADAPENTIRRAELPKLLIARFTSDKDTRARSIRLVGDAIFLAHNSLWTYTEKGENGKDSTLTLA